MGNSEVGHINIGSGRVVPQGVVVIDASIADGTFAENAVLHACFEHVRAYAAARSTSWACSPTAACTARIAHLDALVEAAATAGVPLAVDVLPRRPRHAAALGARLTSTRSKRSSPVRGARARSRPSPGATTRWTATSAGSARERAYDALAQGRAELRAPSAARRGRERVRARRERRVRAADDRRRAASGRGRRRVHLLQLPPRPRAPADGRVLRSEVRRHFRSRSLREPDVRDDDEVRRGLPQSGAVRPAPAVRHVRRESSRPPDCANCAWPRPRNTRTSPISSTAAAKTCSPTKTAS